MEEMGKKVNSTNTTSGQGDFASIMFWSPLQARMMLDDSEQLVIFSSTWGTGKTLCLESKAIQRAQKFRDETVTFMVMQFNSNQKTMLQMEKEARFQHFSNINVIGSENKEDISSILDKTNGSIFIDEFVLEKNMVCPLNKPAMYAKIHPNLPLIWVALAGIRDGGLEDFETKSLSDLLPMFTIAKLNIQIRSNQVKLFKGSPMSLMVS